MIRAAFFVTGKDTQHGDSRVKAGTVTHVAGLLDDGVILNSQEPGARVRSLADIAAWYERNGASTAVRGLDRKALIALASEGKTRYGLDSEFLRYFD
jgi:murein DD-endopeptidase